MRFRVFPVDVVFHDSILVDPYSCQQVEGLFVAGADSVKDQADDDLLPRRASLIPELRSFQVDNVADVLHDTVEGAGCEDPVFVVVCNRDEKFGVPVVHGGTEVVAIPQGEVVGVTSCRSI